MAPWLGAVHPIQIRTLDAGYGSHSQGKGDKFISSPKGLEGHGLFGGGEAHLKVNLQENSSVSASFRGRGMRDRFGAMICEI